MDANIIPIILAFGILAGITAVARYDLVFYAFFLSLPFSVEVELPNGFGTDVPTEQIIWVLTGITLLLFLFGMKKMEFGKYFNVIGWLLVIQFAWTLCTVLNSTHFVPSIKFAVAKVWYLATFYFMAIYMFSNPKVLDRSFRIVLGALLVSVTYVMVRHLMADLAFDEINRAVRPFYRNHVNYAVLMVILLPFLAVYITKYKMDPFWFLTLSGVMVFFIIAIYFSYTRAAIISVIIGAVAFGILYFRWLKPTLMVCSIAVVALGAYLVHNNNYLEYAPNFETTIAHDKFDNLIEATYKLEDISTMERVYRWVAGVRMIEDRPLLGFGPSTFYHNYQNYTLSNFQTYVSDNTDGSTVHNYYMLVWIEQGLFGFLLFIGLCFYALIRAEYIFHHAKDKDTRSWTMAAAVSIVIILAINLINDMIETDKCGSIFFLCLAIITLMSHRLKLEVG